MVYGLALNAIFNAARGLAARKLTLGGMAAVTAAPLVVATAEYATDGAVSQAAIDASVSTIKAGIKSGIINRENVEANIDTVAAGISIANVMNKSAQNQAVNSVLNGHDNPESPEAINAAKRVSMGWMLLPQNAVMLVGKNGVRTKLVDDLYTDRNEADSYLADKFIDDLVQGANVNALGNNRVSRDDIRTILKTELNKPDSALGNVLQGTRLQNGMKQIWPDLYQAPAPDSSGQRSRGANGVTTDVESQDRDMKQNPLMMIVIFLLKLFSGMFKKDSNVTAQTDNPERLNTLRNAQGSVAKTPEIVTHNGQPAPQIPEISAPRQNTPAPALP